MKEDNMMSYEIVRRLQGDDGKGNQNRTIGKA